MFPTTTFGIGMAVRIPSKFGSFEVLSGESGRSSAWGFGIIMRFGFVVSLLRSALASDDLVVVSFVVGRNLFESVVSFTFNSFVGRSERL